MEASLVFMRLHHEGFAPPRLETNWVRSFSRPQDVQVGYLDRGMLRSRMCRSRMLKSRTLRSTIIRIWIDTILNK
jgi:hypothetical protein